MSESFTFLTISVPTVTQTYNITITQTTVQPTTIYQTTLTTTTVTPTYFQDPNVITEDIVIVITVILVFILAVYFGYKQRLNNRLRIAEREEQRAFNIAHTIDSTITPTIPVT
jgi:carbohydrate-binding DOMON domain-containing protein